MPLEVLHGAFVFLGCFTRVERAEVSSFVRLRINLLRIKPVLASLQLPNHERVTSLLLELGKPDARSDGRYRRCLVRLKNATAVCYWYAVADARFDFVQAEIKRRRRRQCQRKRRSNERDETSEKEKRRALKRESLWAKRW